MPIKKLELVLALFYEVAIYQIIPRCKSNNDIVEIQKLIKEKIINGEAELKFCFVFEINTDIIF